MDGSTVICSISISSDITFDIDIVFDEAPSEKDILRFAEGYLICIFDIGRQLSYKERVTTCPCSTILIREIYASRPRFFLYRRHRRHREHDRCVTICHCFQSYPVDIGFCHYFSCRNQT